MKYSIGIATPSLQL